MSLPYNDKVNGLQSSRLLHVELDGSNGQQGKARQATVTLFELSAYNALEYPISLESLFEAYFHCQKKGAPEKTKARQSIRAAMKPS